MPNADAEPVSSTQLPDVPWGDVARFVRQLSHDLRNHLNAAELQSAYIGEIATDSEVKTEIKRLREMLSGLGSVLQKLSADMGHARPNLMTYKAKEFLEDLRSKMERGGPENKLSVEWEITVGDAALEIDPQLLAAAIQELILNAATHTPTGDPLRISASVVPAEGVVIQLSEPKASFDSSTADWGRAPLRNASQGHYGLGLNRARIIIESQGGRLEANYDPSAKNLVTKIVLPIPAGNG